jgi:hypothetical protein
MATLMLELGSSRIPAAVGKYRINAKRYVVRLIQPLGTS